MASSDSPTLYHCVSSYHDFHTQRITAVSLAPDNDLLASASADGTLVVINVSQHKPILCIDFEKPLFATYLLWPHARRLCIGRSDGAMQVVAVDATKMTASIVQALDTVVRLPIRRMAYEGRAGLPWLAIAFMGTVEIYRLETHTATSVWKLVDEVLTDNSDGELVTSLNFIVPSRDKVVLIITHARSGYSLWTGVGCVDRHRGPTMGNAHAARGGRLLASTNLSVGGFDLVPIKDEKLGPSERHYTLEFDRAKNYEIPIRFISSNLVVVGSARGVAQVINVETMNQIILHHGERMLVNVIDSVGLNFATGTGDETGPGVVRFFKPGATAYREITVTGELLDSSRRFALATLYSDYLKKRNTTREAFDRPPVVGDHAPKTNLLVLEVGQKFGHAFCVLGTYKRSLSASAMVCLLAVVIVVLADDPKDITSPTSARWLPAFLRYHILNAFSAFTGLFGFNIGSTIGRWWAAAMQWACRSTGAHCETITS